MAIKLDDATNPEELTPRAAELRSRFTNSMNDTETRMRANMKSTSAFTQDVAAKDYDLSSKYKLPIDTVRRNRDEVKGRFDFDAIDYPEVSRKSPRLAEHLSDPARGPILKPDVKPLTTLEDSYTKIHWEGKKDVAGDLPFFKIGSVGGHIKQSASQGWNMNPIGDMKFRRMLGGDDALSNTEWLELRRSETKEVVDFDLNLAGRAPGMVTETSAQLARDAIEAGPMAAIGTTVGGAIGAGIGLVTTKVSTGQLAAGGAKLGGRLLGGGTMLMNNFKSMVGYSYDEYKNAEDIHGNKIDKETAIGAAVINGTIGSGLETLSDVFMLKMFGAKLPADGLTKDLVQSAMNRPEAKALMKELGKSFLKTGTVEGGTEFTQEGIQTILGELQKMASSQEFDDVFGGKDPEAQSQFIKDALAKASEAGLQGFIGGGGTGVITRAGGAGIEKSWDTAQNMYGAFNDKYKNDQKRLNERKDAVRESTSAEKSPQAFKEFLKSQPDHDVYVAADDVKEFMQSLPPEEIDNFHEMLPQVAEQIETAGASASDIVLSASDVDFMLSQTESFDALIESMKLSPEAITDKDYAGIDILKEFPELRSIVPDENIEYNRSIANFEDKISTMIADTGKYTKAQADKYGYFMGEVFHNLSQRAGDDKRLKYILDKNLTKLDIKQGGMASQAKDRPQQMKDIAKARNLVKVRVRKALKESEAPTEYDLGGEVVKKAKREKAGPTPIINMIANLGGIDRDSAAAKTLKDINVTPKSHPKLFKKGGTATLDTIPAKEFNEVLADFGLSVQVDDDGTNYVDLPYLLEQLDDEARGEGKATLAQQERDEILAGLQEIIDIVAESGLDITALDNAQVSRILEEFQESQGMSFQQAGEPIVLKHEGDIENVETGQPVTFNFVHNPASHTKLYGKPEKGDQYGRDFEPSGRFITVVSGKHDAPEGLISGELTFFNPLVVKNDGLKWKKDLSDRYGGLTGKELSKAVIADGHDGIMTMEDTYITESVDLTTFDEARALYQEADDSIVVRHNINAKSIENVKNIGGLPVPSLAISRVSDPFDSFGDITLIGSKEMIDPKSTAANKVFGADIYSPRYPSIDYQVDIDKYNAVIREMAPNTEKADLKDEARRLADRVESSGIEGFLSNGAVQYHYLAEMGKAPRIPYKKREPHIVEKNAVLKKFTGKGILAHEMQADPKFIEAGIAVYKKKVEDTMTKMKESDADFDIEDQRSSFDSWFDGDNGLNNNLLRNLADDVANYKPRDKKYVDGFTLNQNVRKRIEKDKGFEAWVKDKFKDVLTDERIFDGFTPTGNRRYLPHNLQTVVRILTRKVRDGEGFNYGLPSVRSTVAKQFRSIKAIQDNKDLLLSKEDFEPIKEEMNEEFSALSDLFRPYSPMRNEFGFMDAFSEHMKEIADGRSIRYVMGEYYNDVPESMHAKLGDFLDKLKTMPTEYFEAKLQRVVGLDEFSGALVPRGKEFDTAAGILKDSGVKVTRFKKGDAEAKQEALEKHKKTFFQKSGTGPRGSATFSDFDTVINIFEAADRSTPLHEFSHVFLNILREAGTLGADQNEYFTKQWNQTRNWWIENSGRVYKEAKTYNPYKIKPGQGFWFVDFAGKEMERFDTKKAAQDYSKAQHKERVAELNERGGKEYVEAVLNNEFRYGDDAVNDMIYIALDEQFARGFESYLLEGKAPSSAMLNIFRSFKSWLTSIYGAAKALDVKLNDDVREVFDRLLASDEAIEAIRAVPTVRLDTSAMEMMSAAQRKSYERQKIKHEEEVKEKTFNRAMRDAKRFLKDSWKEEIAQIETDLTDHYEAQPNYEAYIFMTTGKMPDGTEPFGPMKISYKNVVEVYGKEIADSLPREVVVKSGGVDIDMVADLFNYDNGGDFAADLQGLEPLDKRVKREARETMIERHGDVFEDGQMEEVALNYYMVSEAERLVQMELDAATTKTGEIYPEARDFKNAAKQTIADMSVRLAGQANRYFTATTRAARDAGKFAAQKKYEEYADAKRHQLFAMNMYRQTRDFRKEREQTEKQYKKLLKKPKRGSYRKNARSVDPEYQSVIWGLLANYGPVPSGTAPLDFATIQAWAIGTPEQPGVNELNAVAMHMPEEARDAMQKKSFDEMTVKEFRALRDMVKSIEANGRNYTEFMVGDSRKNFNEVKAVVVESIQDNVKAKDKAAISDSKLSEVGDLYMSIQINPNTIFELADGGDLAGPVKEAMKRPISIARDSEDRRMTEAFKSIQAIFKDHYSKKELMAMGGMLGNHTKLKKIKIGEQYFSKMERLMAALNMGNEGNLDALIHGFDWADGMPQSILDTLDKRDMDFVQSVWDYVDTFWPEISELEAKRHGFIPDKVQASPVQTKHGTYKGGYFPIKSDPSKSNVAAEFELERELNGYVGYASTGTSRNHTYERVGVNQLDKRPLLLNFSVISSHLGAIIHDIEMGEAIQQTARLMRDRDVKAAIEQSFGPRTYQQLDLWLKDIAVGSLPKLDPISKFKDWAKNNATVAYMGLSATTILSQPAGLTNGIVGMGHAQNSKAKGAKWMGVGFSKYMAYIKKGQDSRAIQELLDRSKIMRDRAGTMNRDVREIRQTYNAAPVAKRDIQKVLMAGIGIMQKYAVDIPTWLGAYEQAITSIEDGGLGYDEKKALFYADEIVVNYQSSGLSEDLSGVLRGTVSPTMRQSAMIKAFTLAFNYFNNKLNRVYKTHKTADLSDFGGVVKYATDMAMLIWVDALIADLILNRLPGMVGEEGGEEVMKGWAWWILGQPASMFILARDAFSGLKGYTPQTSGMTAFSTVGNFFTQVGQGEADTSFMKALSTMLGLTTGVVPSIQLNRFIDATARAVDGKDIEYKDIIRGRRKEER